MFYLLAILSMLAYSLQGTLLVRQARHMESISLAAYRNISLWITMLPLLWWVNASEWKQVPDHIPSIVLAGITGATALSLGLYAVRFLPVGISNTFKSIFMILTSAGLGFLFFEEKITLIQAFLILLLMVGSIILSFQKNNLDHLDRRTSLGITMAILSGIFTALSFFFMSQFAREVSPFLSGYLWEFGIGVFALLFLGIRSFWTGKYLQKITPKAFWKITLCSSPTLIGTGSFAYAVSIGPIGIISAVGAAGIGVGMVLAYFWYGEKLHPLQWVIILIMMIILATLRIVS